MKNVTSRWGWLALSLSLLALVLTWAVEAYALFCWAWFIASLSVIWLALTRLRLGLTQSLIVGAALLNAAAGVANGLVMTANGMRMPVEPVYDDGSEPAFLDGASDRQGAFCRLLVETDDAVTPVNDTITHYDVPAPHIIRGRISWPEEAPRFAALDDRHGIRICGERAVYSKGDMMGFIGTFVLGVPGMLLLSLGFLWRKIRRKRSAPTGR